MNTSNQDQTGGNYKDFIFENGDNLAEKILGQNLHFSKEKYLVHKGKTWGSPPLGSGFWPMNPCNATPGLSFVKLNNTWLLDSVRKQKWQIVFINKEPAFPEGDFNQVLYLRFF